MRKLLSSSLAFSLILSACQAQPDLVGTSNETKPSPVPEAQKTTAPAQGNRPPIITSLSSDPAGKVNKDGVITFSVEATDPDGDTLRLTWGTTKGLLSATKGTQVQWRPIRFDGSLETGTSIVLVSVDDNRGGIETGHINLVIDAAGNTQIQAPSTLTGPQVVDIHINREQIPLAQGEKFQLQAYAKLDDGTQDERLFWFSSDPEAISVSESGEIQRIGPGNGHIIVLSDRHPTLQKRVYISELGTTSSPQGSQGATSSTPPVTTTHPTPQPSSNSLLSPPSGIQVLNTTLNTVTLSWNPHPNAQSYHIYQDGKRAASAITQTNYTVQGLKPGETYALAVSSVNQGGESTPSQAISVTLPTAAEPTQATSPPVAPTGLNASHVTQTQITLQWQSTPEATAYHLYRDGASVASNIPNTSYTLTNLQANTSYALKVRAVNGAGESADSAVLSVRTAQEPPAPPTGLQASQVNPDGFRLSWQGVSGATAYQVYLNGNPYQDQVLGSQTELTELQPETTYQLQVKALNGAQESLLSSTLTVTTPAAEAPLTGYLVVGANSSIYRIAADKSDISLLTSGSLTSANSHWITYIHDKKVFALPLMGGTPVNLNTTADTENHTAVLSPSGDKVAWRATGRDASNQYFHSILSLANLDGSGLQRLTYTYGGHDQNLHWAPNGQSIIYGSPNRGAFSQIYKTTLDGSGETQLTNVDSYHNDPRWSPDGQKIAYVRHQSGMAHIFLMNPDGSNPTQLSYLASFTKGHLRWEPNGNSLLFETGGSAIAANNQIYRVTLSGSINKLTSLGENSRPVWSPDGKKIAFCSTRDGGRELFVMNPDGSGQVKLHTQCSTIDAPLIWVNK